MRKNTKPKPGVRVEVKNGNVESALKKLRRIGNVFISKERERTGKTPWGKRQKRNYIQKGKRTGRFEKTANVKISNTGKFMIGKIRGKPQRWKK